VTSFSWQDGERTIRFGRGAVADAGDMLGPTYVLLTTPRAESSAPDVVAGARAVHHVRPGLVDEIAGELLGVVEGDLLVALGGGRVIDTAKALAAARPGRRAAAIPTTLSAAEMSRIHRHAAGVDPSTPRVRPAIVISDPALCASQPDADLAASAANALAHAIEAPTTVLASPVPTLAAREGARLIHQAYALGGGERADASRDALALGALLSGYAIDGAGYGLHHVLAQTLVRVGGAAHGPANAAMLPHSSRALRARRPEELAALDAAIGGGDVTELAGQLAERAGAARIRDIGVAEERLDACADAAAQRFELDLTPARASRDEIRALYAAAW
jgi:alcohol dehydrogenase class IV